MLLGQRVVVGTGVVGDDLAWGQLTPFSGGAPAAVRAGGGARDLRGVAGGVLAGGYVSTVARATAGPGSVVRTVAGVVGVRRLPAAPGQHPVHGLWARPRRLLSLTVLVGRRVPGSVRATAALGRVARCDSSHAVHCKKFY